MSFNRADLKSASLSGLIARLQELTKAKSIAHIQYTKLNNQFEYHLIPWIQKVKIAEAAYFDKDGVISDLSDPLIMKSKRNQVENFLVALLRLESLSDNEKALAKSQIVVPEKPHYDAICDELIRVNEELEQVNAKIQEINNHVQERSEINKILREYCDYLMHAGVVYSSKNYSEAQSNAEKFFLIKRSTASNETDAELIKIQNKYFAVVAMIEAVDTYGSTNFFEKISQLFLEHKDLLTSHRDSVHGYYASFLISGYNALMKKPSEGEVMWKKLENILPELNQASPQHGLR